MKLVVLGSNGYRPNDLGHTACYAIPELGVVLDAGTGLYRLADHLQTEEVDVYLSHSHPDHTWGLAYLEFMFWRRLARATRARGEEVALTPVFQSLMGSPPRVRVHAAPEHRQDVEYLVQRFRDHSLIEYVPLEATAPLQAGCTLTSFPVHHRQDEQCFGFRLDHPGGSLAYVTDTYAQPDAAYVQDIRRVDVLLHECYMTDDEADMARLIGHSHITPVAQVAAAAGVSRLVLIHLNALRPDAGEPDLDRAHGIFSATKVAYDGMEIEF